MPGVEGRIDHMSVDAARGRLFVAALGNNTVEVADLTAGRVVRSLTVFSEPQGLLAVSDFNRIYVANGGDGSVRILHAISFETIATVKFDDDADNVRYDAAAKQVIVGYGSGALGTTTCPFASKRARNRRLISAVLICVSYPLRLLRSLLPAARPSRR